MNHLLAIIPGLLFSTAALAQEDAREPSRHELMLAAGYKAAFTCSASFNAGKSPDDIAAHELSRIYPDYGPAMTALGAAEVNREQSYVAVRWAEDMPPRYAVWRMHLGCAQLPPGAAFESAAALPRADLNVHRWNSEATSWPDGDGHPPVETPAALQTVVEAAFDRLTYGDASLTSAVLIIRNGDIIAEHYLESQGGAERFPPQRTWSVAKSIAATVIGAAVEQALIDVDAPAAVPEWSHDGDPRNAITLENLLHMNSGLYSGVAGNRTDKVYFGGSAVMQEAAQEALEAPPGTRWKYANNDTMLAMRALRGSMDDDAAFLRFPYESVLHKIGMWNTTLETDWNGDFILSSQVWTTARDLGRLGLLYLNDGVWNGERILAEGWADYVAAPAPAQPSGGAYGYGAQWWLAGGIAGLPDDTIMARGNRGQYLTIIPSQSLVIVRRGYDGRPGEYFDPAQFSADVINALEE